MPIARVASYLGSIDLNADGDFADPYEDISARTLGQPGVSVQRGRDTARGTGTSMVPASSWDLDNHDRQYSPGAGPIQGQLIPGRAAFWAAQFGDTTTTMGSATATMDDDLELMNGYVATYLFWGKLDEITQAPAYGQQKTSIRALGKGLLRLRGVNVTTSLSTTITTGAAMALVFAAAGLVSTDYVLDADVVANGRILSYWYLDNADAYSAAIQLLVTEGYPAALYEDGQGRIVFEGRNYRTLNARATTSQVTLRDVAVPGTAEATMSSPGIGMEDVAVLMGGSAASLYYTDISYDPGFSNIINDVSVDVTVRTTAPSAAVWTLGSTITLPPAGTTRIVARPTDPFTGAVVPSTANGDIVVSAGAVTATLSQTSGGNTSIFLTAGGAGATITLLQLRAQALTTLSTVRQGHTISTTASVAAYGTRSLSPAVCPGLTTAEASSLADAVVRAYQVPRPAVTLTLVNADGRHLQRQLVAEVSDRMHVVNAHLGLDFDVMLERVEHHISTGGLHVATFAVEQVVEANWAIWDVSLWDSGLFGA